MTRTHLLETPSQPPVPPVTAPEVLQDVRFVINQTSCLPTVLTALALHTGGYKVENDRGGATGGWIVTIAGIDAGALGLIPSHYIADFLVTH